MNSLPFERRHEVLTLQCVSESPDGLLKHRLLSLPMNSTGLEPIQGLKIYISNKFPGEAIMSVSGIFTVAVVMVAGPIGASGPSKSGPAESL